MKTEYWLLIFGALGVWLFSGVKFGAPPPKPAQPCPDPGAQWVLGTSIFAEGYNQWHCVGSSLVLPITQHADGHYYDAKGVFVS